MSYTDYVSKSNPASDQNVTNGCGLDKLVDDTASRGNLASRNILNTTAELCPFHEPRSSRRKEAPIPSLPQIHSPNACATRNQPFQTLVVAPNNFPRFLRGGLIRLGSICLPRLQLCRPIHKQFQRLERCRRHRRRKLFVQPNSQWRRQWQRRHKRFSKQ